jgi:hypothetical protein
LKKKIIMDATRESSLGDRIEGKREIVRQALDDIALEVGNRLREARLDVPVFLTIPRSGYAIVTMATPLDPLEDVWASVTAIVRQVVSDRLDGIILQSHETPCAMAGATLMSAADLTGD